MKTHEVKPVDSPVDVCIPTVWFYPHPAGPPERFRRYAPGLQERGINLRIITVRRSPEEPATEQFDGLIVERIPVPLNDDDGKQALISAVLQHFERTHYWPDVVQSFSSTKQDVFRFWRLRLRGTGMLHVATMMRKDGDKIALRSRLYIQWLMSPFNVIVASSSIMADQLIQFGVGRRRLHTIPNGVDLNRFFPVASPEARAELRRKLHLEPDDEVILFVGLVTPRKSVHTLVQAWYDIARQRPKAKLVIAGAYREQRSAVPGELERVNTYCDWIAELVERSPAPNRVIFTEHVSNVEEYLRAADVFVFPSLLEGMPNVVPEAMASGLACVLTPFVGLPAEFGQPGHEHLLVDRTPESISEAVFTVLNNRAERQRLEKNALAWIKNQMNVQRSLDQYSRLYRQLAHATR